MQAFNYGTSFIPTAGLKSELSGLEPAIPGCSGVRVKRGRRRHIFSSLPPSLPQPPNQAAPGARHLGFPPCILPPSPHHLSSLPPSPSLPKTSCSGETVQTVGEKFRPLKRLTWGKKLPMKLLFLSPISLIRKWILTFDLILCNFSPNSIFITKL